MMGINTQGKGSGWTAAARGFTLVELLVVIAVIALLMSILLPALNIAVIQARDVVCRSNLHQWALVWRMYTDDNDSAFTTESRWHKALERYYKNKRLRLCPAAKRPYGDGGRNPFGAFELDGELYSYGMNYWISVKAAAVGARPELQWKTTEVAGTNKIPVFLDCALWGALPWHEDMPPEYDGQYHYENTGGHQDEMRRFCLNRHRASMNGMFADFSSRKIGLKQLWTLEWNRNWNPYDEPPPVWPEWMRHFKDYE